MSAGRTHQKASIILASGFSLGAIITLKPELFQASIGALIGIMCSPDQDVDSGNIANKIIRTKVGRSFEFIWRLFWSPYSKSFKHGRFASHFPIFSTFVRIFYIIFMGMMPFYAVYILILNLTNYHIDLIQESLWWGKMLFTSWYTIGLIASDTIHYMLDKLTKNVS
jgi:uncharacterized metal-binding protein